MDLYQHPQTLLLRLRHHTSPLLLPKGLSLTGGVDGAVLETVVASPIDREFHFPLHSYGLQDGWPLSSLCLGPAFGAGEGAGQQRGFWSLRVDVKAMSPNDARLRGFDPVHRLWYQGRRCWQMVAGRYRRAVIRELRRALGHDIGDVCCAFWLGEL
jgi:hypothetical protein